MRCVVSRTVFLQEKSKRKQHEHDEEKFSVKEKLRTRETAFKETLRKFAKMTSVCTHDLASLANGLVVFLSMQGRLVEKVKTFEDVRLLYSQVVYSVVCWFISFCACLRTVTKGASYCSFLSDHAE